MGAARYTAPAVNARRLYADLILYDGGDLQWEL